MKLVGYIKEFMENMFTIPVYSDDGIKIYCHQVDDEYKITNFYDITDHTDYFIKVDGNLEFNEGDNAAIVFRGKSRFIVYDRLTDGIPKVRQYFNDEIKPGEYWYANQDVQYFEAIINRL